MLAIVLWPLWPWVWAVSRDQQLGIERGELVASQLDHGRLGTIKWLAGVMSVVWVIALAALCWKVGHARR